MATLLHKIRSALGKLVEPKHSSGGSNTGSDGEAAHASTSKPYVNDFDAIYRENTFGSNESHSGEGSEMGQTAVLREELPRLIRELGVQAMLDLPCGDFNWMRHTDLEGIRYIGGDVVADLIAKNQAAHASDYRSFMHLDLMNDALPECDLIFCRDCLVHLPYEHIFRAIANIKCSKATWLAATTFTRRHENSELYGVWRTLNMQDPPFHFPAPAHVIEEGCPPIQGLDFSDKSMAFWRVAELPDLPLATSSGQA